MSGAGAAIGASMSPGAPPVAVAEASPTGIGSIAGGARPAVFMLSCTTSMQCFHHGCTAYHTSTEDPAGHDPMLMGYYVWDAAAASEASRAMQTHDAGLESFGRHSMR